MSIVVGQISKSRQDEVIKELDHVSVVSRDYIVLVILSCVIATFGLILNSGAIIIGAMLIAPLMSPIIAFSLALVLGDLAKVGRSLATLLLGVVLAGALSAGLGHMVGSGHWNFLAEMPAEILSRTQPTLFDLVVALAGGAAAAYALARPELSATLPGVAIATALMPPVCVAGIGFSLGRSSVTGGAILLFAANFVAISFASSMVFIAMGFGSRVVSRRQIGIHQAVLLSGLLLLGVTIPLLVFMARIVSDTQQNNLIRTTLIDDLSKVGDSSLVSFDSRWQADHVDITATVRSSGGLTYDKAQEIQRDVAARLRKTVAVNLLVIPLTRLTPVAPPTVTAVHVTVVATKVPASPTPLPTPTVLPTAVRTVTPTPTAVPTPLPTSTPIAYEAIGGTDQEGANVRRLPGMTAIVAALPDGTIVQLTGERSDANGFTWVQVVLPDGRVGWIASDFLVPYRDYIAP